jgi:hypothetical protein
MPVNFFEKLSNIISENEVKRKLTISGDLVSYFKTSKATLEAISKAGGNAAIIAESGKRTIKMMLKLDHSDYVICGLRVRVETGAKT